MLKVHEKYPMYAWDRNKGYPTKAHIEGIKIHGVTDLHRRTFRLLPQQLEIF